MAPEHLVVVGASLTGLRAVEAARRFGHDGRIILIGAEKHLPYDRPPLSKEFLDDPTSVDTHFPGVTELTENLDVDVRLGTSASALDVASKTLTVGDETIDYDALLIGTGVEARSLPGAESLEGVHSLRTLDDAVAIRAALDSSQRVVVVGAGFIGSEVASSARKRGLEVTILEGQATPLVRSIGEFAGIGLSSLHERNGTELRCGVAVSALEGDRHVTGVRLADGEVIPADLVIVGIGAAPAVDWLTGSGLTLDNGIVCDSKLQAAPGVWAAGDVARWRNPDFDLDMRLEHWTNAAEQAAHAVRNMLDPEAATEYRHVPYFWSDWYGYRIQFVGVAVGEPTVVTGRWDGDAFAALFRDGDRFMGALTLNRRADIMKYRAIIGRAGTWDEALELAAKRNEASPVV